MDGYYDPVVSQVLQRPIAICGVWGSCIPDVCAHIASYTGVPFVDLERYMEHVLGASLSSLCEDQNKLLELERKCIQDVCSVQPYPMIALRPETMWDEECTMLLGQCKTIYIQIDFLIAQKKVLDWCESRKYTRNLNLRGVNPADTVGFQNMVAFCEEKYHCADIVVQAKRHHPRHIAQDLLERLFD